MTAKIYPIPETEDVSDPHEKIAYYLEKIGTFLDELLEKVELELTVKVRPKQ